LRDHIKSKRWPPRVPSKPDQLSLGSVKGGAPTTLGHLRRSHVTPADVMLTRISPREGIQREIECANCARTDIALDNEDFHNGAPDKKVFEPRHRSLSKWPDWLGVQVGPPTASSLPTLRMPLCVTFSRRFGDNRSRHPREIPPAKTDVARQSTALRRLPALLDPSCLRR